MRDLINLFDVVDRPAGRAQTERLIAAIEAIGGDGRAYQRARSRTIRGFVAEILSLPRVTAAARRLPKYGLQP